MTKAEVKSFAKINLSIDVGPRGENGYHRVDMVMQQLSFHDDVTVEYIPSEPGCGSGPAAALDKSGSFDIEVSTNRYYLPVDSRNLAYQAAKLMADLVSGSPSADRSDFGEGESKVSVVRPVYAHVEPGKIQISIRKRIPVAAGLAGGSGNAAAVLHALNIIWRLKLSLAELMDLGARLGSDVPYCVMGQARSNKNFPDYIRKDPMASACARAMGRGTELVPVVPLNSWMVISKPKLSVSTKEVYEGIDAREVSRRPDNDRLVKRMTEKAGKHKGFVRFDQELCEDFINVLEEYTLEQYPEVADLKEQMALAGARFTLMSGSGPTVFGIFGSMSDAKQAAEKLRTAGLETYWTRTTK